MSYRQTIPGRAEPMIDESMLRERVRDAIATKKLPSGDPVKMWGGNGSGTCCAICGDPVSPGEVGYELEFAEGADGPGRGEYHVHVKCFGAWNVERKPLSAGDGSGTIPDRERRTYQRESP
jgi:hypothetical protein